MGHEHADMPGDTRPHTVARVTTRDRAEIEVLDLGRAPYAESHTAMLAEHARIGAAADEAGVVWLVEHDAVFTAGRATPAEDVEAAGALPIERGGRITFHGPGQLVVYPLLRLPHRDLRRWLRGLETFGVEVCARFGLAAEPSVDGTGVFVGGSKVASIGVAVKRWVSYHGIALNYDMDLTPFHSVRPCGLDPSMMSDLSRCRGADRIQRDEIVAVACACLPALLDSV